MEGSRPGPWPGLTQTCLARDVARLPSTSASDSSATPAIDPLSERVRYDSVSTVVFKFQAHHLFHLFKFGVSRVRTLNELTSFQKFYLNFSCTFLRLEQVLYRRTDNQRITDEGVRKSKGCKLFPLASQPCDLY